MPEIDVRGVSVRYLHRGETVAALDGMDATFRDGMNVIVGYSGSGKTTLLECILGLRPYEGTILLDGTDLAGTATKDRNFAYVTEECTLFPGYTVFDNIAFPLKMLGAGRDEVTSRVREMAELTGLTPCLSRNIKHISAGQQQKTAIARALIKRPSVCLFDEPLSGVDGAARTELRHWMRALLGRLGCMAIYVTHDIREAVALADCLWVVNDGKMQISGDPRAVMASGDPVVESLMEGTFQNGRPLYW